MIKITFPDNSVREYESGVTGFQIAESISPRLAQEVLAVSVNGQVTEINRPIITDAAIKLFKWDDIHSGIHLLT
jgi:threonyl-tRNA synthetase